jgi:hypothetical protein
MHVTRRQSLALIGSAVAAPLMLRTDEANAAFDPVGAPIIFGGGGPGNPERLGLAGFNRDGSTLATWTSFNAGTPTLWCQYAAEAGNKLTPPIQLATAAALEPGTALQTFPVSFPDGTAFVFFNANRAGGPGGEGRQIYVQRMSANRAPVGAPVRINDAKGGGNWPFAERLTNGNVIVAWDGVFCRVLTKSGAFVTPVRRVTSEGVGARPTSIAALSNGRSVICYVSQVFSPPTFTVAVQVLDSNGFRLGNPIVLKRVTTFGDAIYGVGAVGSRLSTGVKHASRAIGDTFEAACYRRAGDGKWKVWAGRFRADGTVLIPQSAVWTKAEHAAPAGQFAPRILPLKDGRSIILQESRPADGQKKILAQIGTLSPAGPSTRDTPFPPAEPLSASAQAAHALEVALVREYGTEEDKLVASWVRGPGGTLRLYAQLFNLPRLD